MAISRNPKDPQAQQDYLFIQHETPRSHNVSLSTVAGQARRWTTNRKNQKQRLSAEQGASYARSLVGWQDPTKVAPKPADPPEFERRARLQLGRLQDVGGGLRNDPFNSLPIEQSQPVMGVTDYFIHTWAELKATNIDTLLGFNTYLEIYWPLALQDGLLMSALLGVAGAAQCLAQGQQPMQDPVVLLHGSKALHQLRERLAAGQINENVIFTMDWLINIAYMARDNMAFNIHWAAFRPAATRFIEGRNGTLTTVVQHRLRSWESLHDYRRRVDAFKPTSDAPLTNTDGTAPFMSLPVGFRDLASQGKLSLETAEILLLVSLAVSTSTPLQDGIRCRVMGLIMRRKMLDFEAHICLALLALSHQLEGSLGEVPEVLDQVAQAFINRHLRWESELERRCLIWCSLVLGNALFIPDSSSSPRDDLRIQRLRTKGHIILVEVQQELVVNREPTWVAIESQGLEDFVLNPNLLQQWRRVYEATMARQQTWSDQGLLAVGKPLAVDTGEGPGVCVEYLVLRDGRGSLPRIEVAD